MPTRIALTAIVTLLCCGPAPAGGDESRLLVDGQKTKSYVAYLSTDAMQGRMTCTDGYRRSADWVAAQLRAWGLKPAGEDGTFFQEVSIRGFDFNTGVPSLRVGGREFPFDDGDFSVESPSTPATVRQGEIVFVGYGIAAAEKGLDEYAAVDVKGKIVLALKGSPHNAPKLRRMFQRGEEPADDRPKEDPWKEETTDSDKVCTACEKGAAAVLLYDPDESPGEQSRRGRYSSRSGQEPFTPERDFLCLTIRERVFRAIMKHDPQESPRGLKRRIDGVRREIQQKKPQSRPTGVVATLKGYDVSVRYDEKHGNNVARNVLAKIEGTDPELKDQYVVVGAHLDHVGVRGGYVYNGADDNASGSAVVMEVARVLSQAKFRPKRTLLFCCWCGEERGLLGSRHYTDRPCDGVSMDRVVACFNVDMVGMGETLGASGALNFPSIWEVIKRDQDPEIIKRVKPSQGGPGGSDHTGFIKRGIEAMLLMSSGGVGHQDYHQPEDDTAKIEPEMLRVAGQFVLQGMVNLAGETQVNLLIDRRQQIYRAMRMQISNFNPKLPESCWTCVELKKKDPQQLYDEILDRARALLKESAAGDSGDGEKSGSQRRPGEKALARGLADIGPIGADTRLLELALDFYGVGRVDLEGDDGVWIAQGRLTDDGKAALKTLEQNEVVVRLVSPGEELIGDMLSAASKPFIMTGDYRLTRPMVDRLNSREVLLGIGFDPKKVGDFITRLEKTKDLLGERGNLFAFLTAVKGLEESKRPLYLGLIDRGWTHNEICGSRGSRGLVGGGSFSTLGPRAERSR